MRTVKARLMLGRPIYFALQYLNQAARAVCGEFKSRAFAHCSHVPRRRRSRAKRSIRAGTQRVQVLLSRRGFNLAGWRFRARSFFGLRVTRKGPKFALQCVISVELVASISSAHARHVCPFARSVNNCFRRAASHGLRVLRDTRAFRGPRGKLVFSPRK